MALGPKEMGEAIIRNLKEKTGKTMEEWGSLVKRNNLSEKKEVIEFLKKENGLGHFQAHKVFENLKNIDQYQNPESFADKIFDSKTSKSLYEFLKSSFLGLGQDARIQPCKTYIPFYRKNQFAVLTRKKDDQIIIGLNLPEDYCSPRLTKGTAVGSVRINFQTIIQKKEDLNQELLTAVQTAYQNN